MRRSLLVALLLGLAAVVVYSPAALAQGSGTPTGGMQCYINGRYVFVPHGGCPGSVGGNRAASQPYYNPNAAAAAAAAAEAERQHQLEVGRQRQQEIEEQRLRDEAAAKQRQADFERRKQEALHDMKEIAEGEFGLKDDGAGAVGLKDLGDTSGGLKDAPDSPVLPGTTAAKKPECQWGEQGSSVVDLRCLGLDPDKPIVLDPYVVRGQERAFPAQIDPATFQNANYNKGYEALMRPTFSVNDAMDAVAYFGQAQLQSPNDPMVRNGLLLAQDILKGRQQKEQEDKDRAMQSLYHGLAALMMGDAATASDSARRAGQLDPGNPVIARWNLALTEMTANFKVPGQDVKTVEELVGNALLSEAWGDFATEVREMEMAKSLAPDSTYVDMNLDRARHLAQEFPVHNAMHPAPH